MCVPLKSYLAPICNFILKLKAHKQHMLTKSGIAALSTEQEGVSTLRIT